MSQEYETLATGSCDAIINIIHNKQDGYDTTQLEEA